MNTLQLRCTPSLVKIGSNRLYSFGDTLLRSMELANLDARVLWRTGVHCGC